MIERRNLTALRNSEELFRHAGDKSMAHNIIRAGSGSRILKAWLLIVGDVEPTETGFCVGLGVPSGFTLGLFAICALPFLVSLRPPPSPPPHSSSSSRGRGEQEADEKAKLCKHSQHR